jgi:hypothetical protein
MMRLESVIPAPAGLTVTYDDGTTCIVAAIGTYLDVNVEGVRVALPLVIADDGVLVPAHDLGDLVAKEVRAAPAEPPPMAHPEPPGNDPERGFVLCPTCTHWKSSVKGESCGDCHYKPVRVVVERYGSRFDALLWMVDGRVSISRDHVWAGNGKWDDERHTIEDCAANLDADPYRNRVVYEALDVELTQAIAALRS